MTNTINFCTKCVVSNQRPRIELNKNSVCNACENRLLKENIDWNYKKKQFLKLLKKYKKNNGDYDVVVPSSGGKDSAVVAHRLKYEFGMNPLTVTWSPLKYTEIGYENLIKFSQSGFPIIFGKPNGLVLRKLTKTTLIEMGDPFQPFIYGQVNFPLHIALKFKIGLIFDGENGEEEYGGFKKIKKSGFNKKDSIKFWFSNYSANYWIKRGFKKSELNIFKPPNKKYLKKFKIERHFWSYYFQWNPQNHFYYSAKNTFFKPNFKRSEGTFSKYASIDDKFDGFHFYLMYLKFGIGRATSDACQEIRNGYITRNEGVKLVNKYDGEFPKEHYEEFLEFCDINEKEFFKICDRWRSEKVWHKLNNKWKLKSKVQQI
jgi:N-acetyl sugar amidotransferase